MVFDPQGTPTPYVSEDSAEIADAEMTATQAEYQSVPGLTVHRLAATRIQVSMLKFPRVLAGGEDETGHRSP